MRQRQAEPFGRAFIRTKIPSTERKFQTSFTHWTRTSVADFRRLSPASISTLREEHLLPARGERVDMTVGALCERHARSQTVPTILCHYVVAAFRAALRKRAGGTL